jgi:CPA1 family monovalent cation:H+ antiporter
MEAEITLSLMMPFAAYLPAERLGVSGVLAAVTAGLLMGRRAHATSGGTRLRRYAFWEILAFLLNSTLFLLVGLAFRDILDKLGGVTAVDLLGQALIIALTVVALRVAWMLLVPRAIAVLAPRRSRPLPSADVVVLGWSGMRGGVSVAAALSVPVAAAGEPFPGRPQIIFFAYVVVLTTLVVPGLTLGPLVGRLGLGRGGQRSRSDARARRHILDAALEHIQELADSGELPEEISDRLRELYVSRIDGVPVPDGLTPVDEIGADSAAALSARRGAIAAQRAALAELETDHRIDAATAREMRRELDREERACI